MSLRSTENEGGRGGMGMGMECMWQVCPCRDVQLDVSTKGLCGSKGSQWSQTRGFR